MHFALVYNAYCERDSRSRVEGRTNEELWAKILDGQAAGLYGSVIHLWEEDVIDPVAWEAEQAELRRIRLTSCYLPPVEDLQLLSWAKKLPAERWAEIDPTKGYAKTTRGKLREIRNEKYNEDLRAYWLAQKHTP